MSLCLSLCISLPSHSHSLKYRLLINGIIFILFIFDSTQTYLSSLTQKTQQARSLNFEEQGDISVSSGADGFRASQASQGARQNASPRSPVKVSAAGSKFLKKKKTVEQDDNSDGKRDDGFKASSRGILIPGTRAGISMCSVLFLLLLLFFIFFSKVFCVCLIKFDKVMNNSSFASFTSQCGLTKHSTAAYLMLHSCYTPLLKWSLCK